MITSVQRRRHWTTQEKVRLVEETYLPGQSVSLVARRHGLNANQLFTWRRLMERGAFTAAGAGEEVVPASELRAAQQQIRELQRLLGKKTLETEILREAMERVAAPKKLPSRVTSWPGTAGERCGRSFERVAPAPRLVQAGLPAWKPRGRRGRPPAPDAALLGAIQALIADLPTYGYRRVHALLRRQAERDGRSAPNAKRVYRVMKVHGLLLQRHVGGAETRRHEGKVAVATRNTRWCSDGLEIAAENGERVRVAFALDCCDREAMSYVATTAGITGEDVRDLMVAAVEHRFGAVNQLPSLIEWLTDNGSCYVARDTRRFARELGLIPKTTPLESPQSNGMA